MSAPTSAHPQVPTGTAARVQVPATSANLGPAFDAAGLSLGLYDEVDVRATASGCSVDVSGHGAQNVPTDESHLVLRAVRAGLDAAGVAQPGLALRATNRIPHGRGLGSSAAATVAGLLVAQTFARAAGVEQDLPRGRLLELASEFEGHADNVGAALLGGLTLVWSDAGGQVHAARLPVDSRVAPVVLVPVDTLSTARARGMIPQSVPHRVAAFNVGRSALLVSALTAHPELLLAATDDRLHQPYRAGAFPESMALVERLRARGLAAVISGAGPSVLVLGTVADSGADMEVPESWASLRLDVDADGAKVLIRSGE
ncbi:MAG: homoserine kinase [Jiangellales bacterium]